MMLEGVGGTRTREQARERERARESKSESESENRKHQRAEVIELREEEKEIRRCWAKSTHPDLPACYWPSIMKKGSRAI